jgi:hypothetical protein
MNQIGNDYGTGFDEKRILLSSTLWVVNSICTILINNNLSLDTELCMVKFLKLREEYLYFLTQISSREKINLKTLRTRFLLELIIFNALESNIK